MLIISFRCAADELKNLTIPEIRKIYSHYPYPHCTPYIPNSIESFKQLPPKNYFLDQNGDDWVFTQMRNPIQDITVQSVGENVCNEFIYDWDFGYKSMTGDVSTIKILY